MGHPGRGRRRTLEHLGLWIVTLPGTFVAGDRRSVLVVDEDEQIRQLLVFLLEQGGYEAQSVGDGLEAVEELRKRRFDVVVADYDAPQLDGLRLSLLMRILWPQTPIVLMCAGPQGVKGWGTELGVFSWLSKPFTSDAVLAQVENAVAAEYVS